jgi:hypothetical protein
MFYRRRPVTIWSGLLALILLFTVPWWAAMILGAIASAFGGNLFPIAIFIFVALWIIAYL